MSEPVRVFLVDDHALFRSGVRAELGPPRPESTVIGEAGSVDEAVAAIRHLAPGRRAARRPHARRWRRRGAAPGPPGAARRGVPGAVRVRRGGGRHRGHPRRAPAATSPRRSPAASWPTRCAGCAPATRCSRRGSPASCSTRSPTGRAPRRPVDPELDLLTRRERDVLRLLARGYAYKEIAGRAVHLGQDRGDARVQRAAQDPAVQPVRAVALGVGPPAGLVEQVGHDAGGGRAGARLGAARRGARGRRGARCGAARCGAARRRGRERGREGRRERRQGGRDRGQGFRDRGAATAPS